MCGCNQTRTQSLGGCGCGGAPNLGGVKADCGCGCNGSGGCGGAPSLGGTTIRVLNGTVARTNGTDNEAAAGGMQSEAELQPSQKRSKLDSILGLTVAFATIYGLYTVFAPDMERAAYRRSIRVRRP